MFALPPASEVSIWHRLGLLVCTLFPLYYLLYEFHPTYGTSRHAASTAVYNDTQFQEAWLHTHLLQPFNPGPIQKFCNEMNWRPDLVFNLANANGGVGNIRAEVLDFVFYAIEAGASIILPSMAKRSEEMLFDVWGAGRANFSTMFDETHFKSSMREACPQLRIFDPDDGDVAVVEGTDSGPTKLGDVYWPEYPLSRRDSTKEDWLRETDLWLSNRNVTFPTDHKWIVDVERSMWRVDTRNTPPGFRFNYPRILRINPSIRHYAGLAMSHLAREHHADFTIDPLHTLHPKAFYGAHLRTESDTIDAGWQTPCSATECGLNFTSQTDGYISHAIKNNLNIIFAASGNASEIQRFKVKAAVHVPPLTVVDKFDLLDLASAKHLKELHWDQQALVDLEILKRCSVFGGMAKSSFAATIATARNTWLEQRGVVMENPWDVSHRDVKLAFEDRVSKIWGRNEAVEWRVPKGGWP